MNARPRHIGIGRVGFTGVGFTLVELLAVVTLLGLVAALTVGVIAPLASGQRRVLAESALREAVQRARLTASRQGGCVLELGAEMRIISARAPASGLPAPTLLPKGWSAHAGDITREEGGASIVAFGPDGVAEDAAIYLAGPRGERIALRLRGLSGKVERAESEP